MLQRIWNHGNVRVVATPASRTPVVTFLPGLSLINNANAGSAHFAMYFAFPAVSLALASLDRLQKSSVDAPAPYISTIIHRMDAASIARAPWTKDAAPLLYTMIGSPRVLHGYDALLHDTPCVTAVL